MSNKLFWQVRKAMKKHVSEKSKVVSQDCKTLNTNHSDEKKKLIDEGVESFEDTLASKISASVMGNKLSKMA